MIRIVLIDDHTIFRQGLSSLLKSNGEIDLVAEASDGRDGLDVILKYQPDVAVIDISLPRLNGLDIAKRVFLSKLDIHMVLLTTHADPALVQQGWEAGVLGFVLKENSFEELLQGIKQASQGKRFTSRKMLERLDAIDFDSSTKSLSLQEKSMIMLVSKGLTDKEIARQMNISPSTVNTYKSRIRRKLNLRSKAEMAHYATKMGFLG
ncbi:response regulator transcription factor [Magnetococcales bacterium HHB-1]